MKKAHITARPDHKVGDEVISLCGKEFTVKVLWADIAFDKPICRKCVDIALEALTDAEGIIETARIDAMLAVTRLSRLDQSLNSEDATKLDEIAEADRKHRDKVEAKQRETAELEQARMCLRSPIATSDLHLIWVGLGLSWRAAPTSLTQTDWRDR
jgi:hypothetical protein